MYKVIALLSGGKDSCFALLHCIRQGHQIVAIGNLCPEEGIDELDSFMYQSVGQTQVELIAQAIGLPLFKKTITGRSLQTGAEYVASNNSQVDKDETEDLYELLDTIKRAIPQANAVCTGAILSNYQRVRVENVCQRHFLISLAPLWQRSQIDLLREMSLARMHSIVLKVAGMGLSEKDLGKDVCDAQFQSKIMTLNSKYGIHPCGEGGEYETFTLDSPVFQKRIVLVKTEHVITDRSPIAPVAYLRILEAALEEKDPSTFCGCGGNIEDQRFLQTLVKLPGISSELGTSFLDVPLSEDAPVGTVSDVVPFLDTQRESNFKEINDLFSASVYAPDCPLTLEDEVESVFSELKRLLDRHNLTLRDIAHVNLYLSASGMSHFAAINQVYKQHISFPSPPSRACVAVQLDERRRVFADVIGRRNSTLQGRIGLHVQSLSYWAPANIGPYSQAITVGGRVFIAGQIPLIPHILELPTQADFSSLAASSLIHSQRVIEAVRSNTGGGWTGWMESVICWIKPSSSDWSVELNIARAVWKQFAKTHDVEPPVCFVVATALPKNARIEWQCSYQTGRGPNGDLELSPTMSTDFIGSTQFDIIRSEVSLCAQVSWPIGDTEELSYSIPSNLKDSSMIPRLYYRTDSGDMISRSLGLSGCTSIPVQAVATLSSDCLGVAIYVGDLVNSTRKIDE